VAYLIKELFLTLQGEGVHAGRVAVFCRFAGCNLWSGREEDRANATCRFCDTDFRGTGGRGGGRFESAEMLANRLLHTWGESARGGRPYVVFTGGEPMLQLNADLVDACHTLGLEVAVETNGTLPLAPGIDWTCVSPKAGSELVVVRGDELKLVFPQPGAMPSKFEHLDFRHYSLQPMDGVNWRQNARAAVDYCHANPKWRLSVQTHKMLEIP
jgi:7-carboxy-7-deazaguanine synthase